MHTINPALETEYNNRALVPEHPAIFDRWRQTSSVFRSSAQSTLDLLYGPAERHRLDLFHAPHARGTVVFIHGGYWRSLDKSDFSFVAAPFVERGLSVVAINYRLCPTASVAEIVEDCRDAMCWLVQHGIQHGVPVDRIALTGHSAGGHLVAMLFATDWRARNVDPSCFIGGAALSGVFDLEPLLECSMNGDLRLASVVEARAVSPIHHAPVVTTRLYLAVGADESAAFRAQTRLLQRAWPTVCPIVDEVPASNHFTIVDRFVQANSGGLKFVEGLFR